MLTYEVRIKIDLEVEQEWLHWMKTRHVPKVIATGYVRSFQILKSVEEATYNFHYHFESEEQYEQYIQEHAERLRAHGASRYPNRFSAQRNIYQWI